MDKQGKTTQENRCSVCGDPCPEKHRGALQGAFPNDTGGSDHYLVHLCQGCFLGALSYLRQERRIMHLFSNAPCADETFGLVMEPKNQPRP